MKLTLSKNDNTVEQNLILVNYRICPFTGGKLRKILMRVGEVRSSVQCSFHVMALTAIATIKYCERRCSTYLGWRIHLLWQYPHQIMYLVKAKESLNVAFLPMLKQVQKECICFPRTIIYCRKFSNCGNLYAMFRDFLGQAFTEPQDAPDLPQFRLVVWTPLLKTIYPCFSQKVEFEGCHSNYCFWHGDTLPWC